LQQNYYDRAILVTVLGEIPDQQAAIQELYNALKPGGILSVSEMIFDPHFQRMGVVLALANGIGFEQKKIIGNRFAYTMHLQKPNN
jgi:ubiquinone/menaquinone biosynthesis C-methylase UbiE